MGRDKTHRVGTGRVGRLVGGGGLLILHPLENKSLTRKQAKKTDISREQHSKQAKIRQGKLRSFFLTLKIDPRKFF